MPLNNAQKTAVEYLDGPLLVLAGPGTGKTQLLSSKVEYILNNTDANPANILCLTYTESGATNMRDRLFSMIGSAAAKIHIHTYHAFGSTILAEYKNYAEHFDRNLDAAIDSVTQYKIIKSIKDQLGPFDIMKHANVSDIISTISEAKSARLTGKDLEKIAKDNIATAEKLNPKLDDILQNLKRGMKFDAAVTEIYTPIMNELAEFYTPEPICADIKKEACSLLEELNSIIQTESAKEKPSVSPLTAWKNRRFELDDDGHFRLSNRIANKKLLSTALIMQQYEAYLETSGLYDFADMIQQAIKILKKDIGFKLTLEERYQYILLDEFQDTNAAQAELIYCLSDYEKPTIMAVGDDDQAIFAFQGANVSNLINFRNHYNAKVVTLLENYRSNTEILDMSYRVREQIDDSFARQQKIDKRLLAHKNVGATISRHEFIESSAEYHWVATEIKKLIGSGVSQSEIAIITPKHKYVAPLLPYLKSQNNINIAYEKRDNLFDDPRIHELLTLARFIYELSIGKNPAHLLFEVLSFPFLEISPIEAIQAVHRSPGKLAIDYLLESKSEKLQQVGSFLTTLAQKSATAPLEQFLDYLIGTASYDGEKHSNFLSYYTASDTDSTPYSAFELYENLAVLREAVLKHQNTPNAKLVDLINFEDDYLSAEAPLVNTSPYQDATDSVQILTAHKSKGLEFEYVFIIATDDRAWGNAKGNNNMLALPQNLASIRHTGITEDERLRLFFVAITRAKSHLILTNSIKDFSGKNPARLQYLAEYEKTEIDPFTKQEITTVFSPYLPTDSQVVNLHYQFLPEDEKKSDLVTAWVSNYQHLDGELRPVLIKRMENYRLTATDLTSFIDIVYGGPQAFYRQKVLRAPDETYSESLTFGNLIHSCFEKVTNEKLSDEAALELYQNNLATALIPEEDIEEMRERGLTTLKTSLQQFGSLLRDENARAEVNFSHDNISLKDVPLTGKIDHIHIDPKTKTIEVYDFKTSGFKDKKWDSHPTLFKYKLQLGFYKLLLNLSPEYSNYKVKKAHILFVVPDGADAKVHDKIYEYNDEDEEFLKSLLVTVYQHIKSLDYVDNPALFVAPDSSKSVKDIKEFISLLQVDC